VVESVNKEMMTH